MTSNYPPGVTGNEYEIAGPDYEKETDIPCPQIAEGGGDVCEATTTELGFRGERWLVCLYEHVTDLERDNEPDPDQAYDEARDRKMLGDFDPTDTDLSNDETTMLGQPF